MKKMILLAVAFVAFVGVSNVSAQTEWQQRGQRHMEMGNRFDNRDMRGGNRDFRNNEFAYGRERNMYRDGRTMMRRDNREMYPMRRGYNNCGQQVMYR